MKQNVGGWDRNVRWIIGGAALLAGLTAPVPRGWRIGLISLGASNLFSAATRYCPVNQALGVDTREQPLTDALESATRRVRQMT